MTYVELNEMLKEVLYLSRLGNFLKDRGLTIDTATQQDFYSFITKEEQGKLDYYTQKPVPVSYTAGMQKIEELVPKYRKLKVIVENLLENEVL